MAINNFEGKLKWNIINKPESKNFLILPIINGQEENDRALKDREHVISLYGENNYRKKIDECIDDIPKAI